MLVVCTQPAPRVDTDAFSFSHLLRLCRASFAGGLGGSTTLRNDFVKDLRQIDALGATIPDTVPLDVLVAVDRGRNPEAVTKETLYVKVAVMVGCGDSVVQHMSCWWDGACSGAWCCRDDDDGVDNEPRALCFFSNESLLSFSGCHAVCSNFRVLLLTCLGTSVFLQVSVSTWY